MDTTIPEENLLANYGAWRLKAITPHTQKLLDDFPKLFRPCASPFGDWGFQCGEGWFDLVYQLCADIEQAATAAKLDPNSDRWPLMRQIKAKFAVLRVYFDLLNPDQQDDELRQGVQAGTPENSVTPTPTSACKILEALDKASGCFIHGL